ncbi:MAG: DUF3422 domain-containing protein, partial [Devosiaceae bacterium]|nr:DUF3422 domain-containing protein [Devosiaceae bacterium MH13]
KDAHGEVVATDGALHIKWERHTEFIALTQIGPLRDPGASGESFGNVLAAIAPAPEGTSEGGTRRAELFARMRMDVDLAPEGDDLTPQTAPPVDTMAKAADPVDRFLLKVVMNGGAIRLSTNLHHNADGAVAYRAEVKRSDIQAASPNRIGRFVQRVIEVESYRLLAYLAVPLMQELGPRVSTLETRVNAIAQKAALDPAPQEEAEILTELTSLSAELQSVGSASEFRFAASLAYAAIVDERLTGLREDRIEGYQRLSTAVKRRLDPAMRSSKALLARQEQIASRIGYITDLLRTRVDLTLQDQNAEVLRSIDARANAQLRLQRAVEGLSVVAITYYTLGILYYLVQGTPWDGFGLTSTLVQAALVVPVVLLVFFGVQRARKRAERDEGRADR